MNYKIFSRNKSNFAIEVVVELIIDERWVYGNLFFWAENERLGSSFGGVDLKGAMNWFATIEESSIGRVDNTLYSMALEDVFDILMSIYVGHETSQLYQVDNIDAKFSITDLGMTSFDATPLFLIENSIHEQRFIWATETGEAREAFIGFQTFERLTRLTVQKFRDLIEIESGKGFTK